MISRFRAELRIHASIRKKAFAVILLALCPTTSLRATPLEEGVAAAHSGEYARANQLLRPLADAGDARAQFNLGYVLVNGWGQSRDEAEGVRWYRKAADQGLPIAQHHLALAYAYGEGVGQNDADAVNWSERAADQGLTVAQFMLGLAYANGWGVDPDATTAFIWINLAMRNGGLRIAGLRANLASRLTDAQRIAAQKVIQSWRPKAENNLMATAEARPQDLLGTDPHGAFADPTSWPAAAVGAVTLATHGQIAHCTGTLVGPSLVLTAAHCLFLGHQLVPPGTVHFQAGLNKATPAEIGDAARLIVPRDFSGGEWTAELSSADWALIILKTPLSIKPIPVKVVRQNEIEAISKGGTASEIGYGAERLYSPSIQRGCHLSTTGDDRIFLFRCLLNFGYSGSAIMADVDGSAAVIGVVSAGSAAWLQGIACSARQFAQEVANLNRAKMSPDSD